MRVKRVLTWGGVAFLMFFIAYRPDSVSEVFSLLGSTLAETGSGLWETVTRLVA